MLDPKALEAAYSVPTIPGRGPGVFSRARLSNAITAYLQAAQPAVTDDDRERIADLEARLAKAREALEPFSVAADAYDPEEGDDEDPAFYHQFLVGHLRRARSTLEALK